MWLVILKCFCFILVCLDTIGYIMDASGRVKNFVNLFGFMVGIAARVFLLYGVLTYWILV